MKFSAVFVAVVAASTALAAPFHFGPACRPGDIDCLPNGELAMRSIHHTHPSISDAVTFKRDEGLEARSVGGSNPHIMNYFGTDFDTRFGFPSKREMEELAARGAVGDFIKHFIGLSGAFGKRELEALEARGAVGDFIKHFIGLSGAFGKRELEARGIFGNFKNIFNDNNFNLPASFGKREMDELVARGWFSNFIKSKVGLSGAFGKRELEQLKARGAVGDFIKHFIGLSGAFGKRELEELQARGAIGDFIKSFIGLSGAFGKRELEELEARGAIGDFVKSFIGLSGAFGKRDELDARVSIDSARIGTTVLPTYQY